MSARDVIAGVFRLQHRDLCYPDASSGECLIAADAIIAELEASGRSIVHKDEIHAPSVAELPETRGPYDAVVCKDVPADCCDYGVISLSEGREVCRVWREQDARAIAAAQADYASRIRSALVATPPAERVVEAAGYAERLAIALWEKHYRNAAPNWKPLTGDLIGILTQIDNMTSGLALATKPAVKDDETVVEALPPTREYVDRIVRIFRDRPADDTSAVVLQDYARAAALRELMKEVGR